MASPNASPTGTCTITASQLGDGAYEPAANVVKSITIKPAPAYFIGGLSLSEGTLSPAFSPTVTSYSASVSAATRYVNVRPIYTTPGLSFRVNGNNNVASGAASQLVLLAPGPNTITIWSTARTGERKVYRITVTRLS